MEVLGSLEILLVVLLFNGFVILSISHELLGLSLLLHSFLLTHGLGLFGLHAFHLFLLASHAFLFLLFNSLSLLFSSFLFSLSLLFTFGFLFSC